MGYVTVVCEALVSLSTLLHSYVSSHEDRQPENRLNRKLNSSLSISTCFHACNGPHRLSVSIIAHKNEQSYPVLIFDSIEGLNEAVCSYLSCQNVIKSNSTV